MLNKACLAAMQALRMVRNDMKTYAVTYTGLHLGSFCSIHNIRLSLNLQPFVFGFTALKIFSSQSDNFLKRCENMGQGLNKL